MIFNFMFKSKYKALLIAVLAISIKVQAQKENIQLLCSPRQNSILLRWAPANSKTWRLGNEYGYIVKRYTVLQGKKIPKDIPETTLTPEPYKPAPLEKWEKHVDGNKYIGIAAECIYGSYYKDIPAAGNPHIAYKKYKEEKHRFSFALFAADQSLTAAELSGLYLADKAAKPDEKYLYRVYINSPDSLASDTAFAFTGLSEYQPLPKPIGLKAEWKDKEANLSWNIQYLNHIYNSYILEKSTDGGKTYKRASENAIVQVSDKGVNPDRMYKTDTLPDNKTTFYYRVRGTSAFGEVGPPSDSIFGTGTLPITTAPVITDHQVIDNKEVKLQWEYPQKMNGYISGFKIYRSTKPKGRKKLVYAGKEPESREFMDSTANFTNYYMISVYNQQTEKFSSIKTYAERVDSFPPGPPTGLLGKVDSTGKVAITWPPNSDEDLEGYRVYRANNPKFEFMLAAPAVIKDTVFTDSINIKTLTKNIYYKVKAVDVRQNQSAFSELLTLKRPDIIPPVSPVLKNIEGKDGGPELTWVNSSSTDVIHHHVYRKEMTDSLYQKIGTIEKQTETRSTFTDKQTEAGKEYVYYVAAVDDSGLESKPSNTGYFKIPSGITESIKLKKRAQTDRVKLTWKIESEKAVKRILVYRAEGDGQLRLYGNSEEDIFMDKKIRPEKTYRYAIKAVYDDGSTSALSKTITVKM